MGESDSDEYWRRTWLGCRRTTGPQFLAPGAPRVWLERGREMFSGAVGRWHRLLIKSITWQLLIGAQGQRDSPDMSLISYGYLCIQLQRKKKQATLERRSLESQKCGEERATASTSPHLLELCVEAASPIKRPYWTDAPIHRSFARMPSRRDTRGPGKQESHRSLLLHLHMYRAACIPSKVRWSGLVDEAHVAGDVVADSSGSGAIVVSGFAGG